MIHIEKFKDVTLVSESGKVQYLWAIVGMYGMTLIQVYAPEEPITLLKHIQDNYEK